jgi:hypothetical protein
MDPQKRSDETPGLSHAETADRLAEEESRARLAMLEASFGVDRIETASELNRLAQILQKVGKGAEAAKIRKRITYMVQHQYSR